MTEAPIAERLEALLRRLDGDGQAPAHTLRDELAELHRALQAVQSRRAQAERLEEERLQVRKMEALGRLADGVAHDFNNLLMGIMGCCRLAERKLSPDSPALPYIEEMRAGAERGTALTRQLLEIGRKKAHQARAVELDPLVREVVDEITRRLGGSLDVTLRLQAGSATVFAERGHLERILSHLAANARDAMGPGGRVTIETGPARLDSPELAARPDKAAGAWVRLTVSDSGPGMDAATLAQAFEPFFTTRRDEQHAGLGLTMVYGLVEQLGGFVQLDSAPGQGCTVVAHFPRVDEVADELEVAPVAEARATGPGTVVVVEDERLVRMTVCDYLRSGGYEVFELASPEEALSIVEAHDGPVDLLLTDMVMPGMNGRELAARLGRTRPDMRVLYMSAYPGDWLIEHGHLESGVATLAKPFTGEELLEKVAEVMGR